MQTQWVVEKKTKLIQLSKQSPTYDQLRQRLKSVPRDRPPFCNPPNSLCEFSLYYLFEFISLFFKQP
jgi:lysozyme family protein